MTVWELIVWIVTGSPVSILDEAERVGRQTKGRTLNAAQRQIRNGGSEMPETSMHFTSEFIKRFTARRREAENGCLLWTAGKDRKGYGAISFNARMLKAHRVAWELRHGTTPNGLVCHRCDTPACVNPAHLFIGSAADNTADMVRKGRVSRMPRAFGEANGGSRATADVVREIRDLRRSGLSLRQIAAGVGISNSQVGNIVRGKHWGWLS